MRVTIRAHFDGRVIVPDEPVKLPVDEPLSVAVEMQQLRLPPESSEHERIEAYRQLMADRVLTPPISIESLRRENLYGERGEL